jgi:hypothetical protein
MSDLYCTPCKKTFKSQSGLKSHNTQKHMGEKDALLAEKLEAGELEKPSVKAVKVPVEAPREAPKEAEVVTFLSPRAPYQTVTIRPTEWKIMSTPLGDRPMMIEGKYVEFDAGKFATNDPEIIDYFEKKYNSPRFPVISNKILDALKRGA